MTIAMDDTDVQLPPQAYSNQHLAERVIGFFVVASSLRHAIVMDLARLSTVNANGTKGAQCGCSAAQEGMAFSRPKGQLNCGTCE